MIVGEAGVGSDMNPSETRKPKLYECPLCHKIQENVNDYIKHRMEECEKTTKKNREAIEASLKQIGLL